jgi:glutamate/tyrosine decarboxylase-like PLP-dependent enzyme
MAIFCALAAARNTLLLRQGWDVNSKGLFGAPLIRVVLGNQAHSSVFKALSLLGLGKDRVELVPVDNQGRMLPDKLPPLDDTTLVIAQAGNVNSGAIDPLDEICALAHKANAWVHVDGAIGLWAAVSKNTYPLIKGLEGGDSWSVDAHKVLNAPYDCGIVLCKNRGALVNAMQATASYIQYSDNRDGMLYTTEMSRRARSIELWATLKALGSDGIAQLVDSLCGNARYFAAQLAANGFEVANDVVFNQVLVRCETPERTADTLKNIQSGEVLWCGGATWEGKPVIRLSVCSWKTTNEDIDACVEAFIRARETVKNA